jgi:hypothetical protein
MAARMMSATIKVAAPPASSLSAETNGDRKQSNQKCHFHKMPPQPNNEPADASS